MRSAEKALKKKIQKETEKETYKTIDSAVRIAKGSVR